MGRVKALAVIDWLSILWKSNVSDKIKRNFFQVAVGSILQYECTTWTLTKRIDKKLDGNCTIMPRAILNASWMQHSTKENLYGHLASISKIIQIKPTRHTEDCWRNKDKLKSDVLQWTPSHGPASVEQPTKTYLQQLSTDTRFTLEDMPEAINDRHE